MSAAFAVSRDENDIFRIDSTMGEASKDFMSMCSMASFNNSLLVVMVLSDCPPRTLSVEGMPYKPAASGHLREYDTIQGVK
jgi:hypothetical protein